jgi:DeoR family transcriptional regulator, suf operon transcriptional repressor
MGAMTPGLAGQRGLRGEILVALKKSQPVTAKELAGVFEVSTNAIRRHLKELEAEGLVQYTRENRGTGAPTFAFSLSENGEALFPTQYGEVLADVLELVARNGGRQAVREMFAERFREQADRIQAELPGASLEKKVEAVVALLSDQGFMAAWSNGQGTLTLTAHNCSVRSAAEQFPEICAAEANFLQDVLQADVKRNTYIPEGCNACQYSISLPGTPAAKPEALGYRGSEDCKDE